MLCKRTLKQIFYSVFWFAQLRDAIDLNAQTVPPKVGEGLAPPAISKIGRETAFSAYYFARMISVEDNTLNYIFILR